jgi:RNA polymerase sigma-70 factor (TIGR02960 family)
METMHDIADARDESAFTAVVERHRRELHVHCYRMLGSLDEAEDLTQETFLRAWRKRDTFQGRSTLRAWLYRIATNACLDALERRPRRATTAEVPWLQPYPDELLENIPAPGDEPDAVVVARETIELAFMVAVQHLPPRPRAVLILRDVLGWSAKDTAALLETSVPAANSALQRARAAMAEHLPERRAEWASGADPAAAERELVQRYIDASEEGDAHAIAALMREDARFSMPPEPGVWEGRDAIAAFWVEGGFGTAEFGRLRCLTTRANHQPAVANYVLRAGDDTYRPLAVDVLRIEEGAIAEIITFGPDVYPALGLPATA